MIPHFDYPFRFINGRADVVDQDTIDDIMNCVRAIMLTYQGDRLEIPEFGIPNPTFDRQPVDIQGILQAITDYEPRAVAVIEQNPDKIDPLIARLVESITKQEV